MVAISELKNDPEWRRHVSEGYSYGYAGGGGTGMMKWMLLVDVMIMDLAAFVGMFSLTVDIGLAIFSMFIVVLIILWNKSSA